jgi:hypothetical protein
VKLREEVISVLSVGNKSFGIEVCSLDVLFHTVGIRGIIVSVVCGAILVEKFLVAVS